MDIWNSCKGLVRLEVLGADIPRTLSRLHDAQIELLDIQSLDEMRVNFSVDRNQVRKVKTTAEKNGDRVTVIGRRGLYWKGMALLKRPVLLLGLTVMTCWLLFLPTRVLFIRVEGNTTIPTQMILEEAEKCGIYFGAPRSLVRSEKMKNALLEAMPGLQWAGINTAGCVATITVRERELGEAVETKRGVSSLVADRDGVILSCTAARGNLLCRAGQAVKAGEILISGYTDCGLSIRATNAKGEVYALTQRSFSAVTPKKHTQRGRQISQKKKYSIIIGKNRINFFKDSGILADTCVRMYEKRNLTLPGGFVLPIALVTETWVYYESEDAALSGEEAREMLSGFSARYLQQQMMAGRILSAQESISEQDAEITLNGQYQCQEMIARIHSEEIITPNGKND